MFSIVLICLVKYFDRIEFDFQEFIRALKCDDNVYKKNSLNKNSECFYNFDFR